MRYVKLLQGFTFSVKITEQKEIIMTISIWRYYFLKTYYDPAFNILLKVFMKQSKLYIFVTYSAYTIKTKVKGYYLFKK